VSRRLRLATLAAALLAAACAVGPDFHRPAPPAVAGYDPAPLPTTLGSGAAAQALVPGADVPAAWWEAFGSAAIDAAVQHALAANADLAAARAALRVAEEQAAAQRGVFWPRLDASWTPTRQRAADALSPPLNSGQNPFTLHTAQLSVGYTLDLFGGQRRALESAAALAEFQRFQTEAARTSLATNVVAALVREAALHGEVEAAERAVALQQQLLALTERQRDLGAASTAAVVAQQASLAQTQAALPPLRKQWAQTRDLLAALQGAYPDAAGAPSLDLGALALPAVPVSLPSRLVEQRPDIRAAEALAHSASAQVGVATANLLPQLTLSGNLGRIASQANELFSHGDRFWAASGQLAQPVFAGGTLWHQRKAAQAGYQQAMAQYRSTVIDAFQNVADSLHALAEDAAAVEAARAAEAAARRTADFARRQQQVGDISHAATLQAEIALEFARAGTLDAESNRYADTAALFQALGGGWWQAP